MDIVIIGDNDIVTLATNLIIQPIQESRNCASLEIENGSTLDIGFDPSLIRYGFVHPNGNGILV